MAERMEALVDAGIALSSELSLDALLQRVVETAAELTEARYAALGVIDSSGRELERFITHGVDPETHAAIGELPRGRGILGVLIRDAHALRLENIADDPRSVGFPPNHPPMRTFLGVPILLRGTAYGNLYLSEKEGGQAFTPEDERLVTLLASQAAVAIENARLYESVARWSRQLESMEEITTAIATELHLPRLLGLVAQRLRELVDARLVAIWLPAADGGLQLKVVEGGPSDALADAAGTGRDSKVARVFERGRSERIDSVVEDPESMDLARRLEIRSALWVPLLARNRAIGVMIAADKRTPDGRFTDEDLRLAETFAARAAVAVDLSERVGRDALRRVVDAQEVERRRLARELHDETGQALTSILLGLRAVEEAPDAETAHEAGARLRELVVQTLQDVRRLAVELRPKALDDFGLVPALERLTEGFSQQTGIAVELESRLAEDRLPGEVETIVYRVVQEALTNVVKHAHADHVSIVLRKKDRTLTALIEDDGRGFSADANGDRGLGLVGMRERVELVDGTLSIESSAGTGTTLLVEIPIR
ncbi:MAG TPA: GAF domain-containing protein [Gaiellaceae bacterium]|nr:GAF domain-containing protein [Gaiellaceae bacterium]